MQKVSSSDVSSLEKQKLFTISNHHPDGTLFHTDEDRFLRVESSKLHPIISENAARSYSRTHSPIFIQEHSKTKNVSCVLTSQFSFSGKTVACKTLVEELEKNSGNTYIFEKDSEGSETFLEVTLTQTYTEETIRTSLGLIKERLALRFGEIIQ